MLDALAAQYLQANVAQVSRSINLDLALYGDEDRRQWGSQVERKHLVAIKQAGFTAIRLPLYWAAFQDPKPPYMVDPAYFPRVNRVIDLALEQGLAVILDNHKDKPLTADPAANHDRFLALWSQLATYYSRMPPQVMYEPFAEPCEKLDDVWNAYFADALKVIRTYDPHRTVLVGPAKWNAVSALPMLELPKDDGLLVVFHDYFPIPFSFQGEEIPGLDTQKWLGQKFPSKPAALTGIGTDLDAALAWSKAHQRPIFLEEFGSSANADSESRARHLKAWREGAEARKIPWSVWSFASTYSFYDLEKDTWMPGFLEALGLR